MFLIRAFEFKTKEIFSAGKIPGFVHLSIGQEAVAVGVCSSLRKDDYIAGTHRGHGHCIAKGADIKLMFAELFGKKTGYCKGKGGSMHIADFSVGFLGNSGIVGAGVPAAVGAALSAKLRGSNQVAAAVFGDGSSNQGVVHESMNLASVWELPVVFVCENNLYMESTPARKDIGTNQPPHLSVENVSSRGVAYSMEGFTVDGNDVWSVYDATSKAVEKARRGQGPTLIECITYRWMGHEEGEPWETYRTKEEVEEWKKRDPIKRAEKELLSAGVLSNEDIERIKKEVDMMIEEAVKFAEESPWPEAEEAFKDIFVTPYY
ncbi:thiamine pyrophosphate-dependent dehydrogenase E1 component subunit alpha [[Eubacterium] cellulosolvens]